ncbi:MAG: hypothetical protein NC181_01670 [Clostridium sp.]|nr:hypothetical protein [Clostridium sp.]MCM1444702.1 hypothetical protein [Candidatus Amulumruptor caecigallinarius]
MKIFINMGYWIKSHLLVTIIIGTTIIGGITTLLIFNNSNLSNETSDSKVLPDGTYSCELMYNGQSFDNDDAIKEWLKKLATYESSIDVDNVNISDFRKNLFEEFGSNNYIVKDNNIIKLYLTADGKEIEYIIYNINNNQFTLNKELYSDGGKSVESILNKSIKTEQTKDSFTYDNFGFILIYPSIYNNIKNNATSEGIIDIDYNKYTGLGDLVCKTKISSLEQKQNNQKKAYDEIIDKYRQVLSYSSKDDKLSVGVTINENYAGNKYYYTLYDVNGDGIDELILAEDYNVPNPFEIYYLDGNRAVPAIGQLKYNDISDIYENGQVSIYIGGGARNDIYKYLGNVKSIKQKVSNWKDFKYILYYDSWVYGPEYLKYDENQNEISISETDFNDIISFFGRKLDYSKWDWKTIEVDRSKQYLGKYVGTGSEYASTSYVELLENNKARVNINYCGGWSLYTGNYGFATTDYTDDDVIIYINSFSILDGDKLDMPEYISFQVDDKKLHTLIGYLGSNNFDCGVSTTFVRK